MKKFVPSSILDICVTSVKRDREFHCYLPNVSFVLFRNESFQLLNWTFNGTFRAKVPTQCFDVMSWMQSLYQMWPKYCLNIFPAASSPFTEIASQLTFPLLLYGVFHVDLVYFWETVKCQVIILHLNVWLCIKLFCGGEMYLFKNDG